eukprot:COSAG06_NODE_8871_length_2045_cov_1.855087_2_plen_230_part_01
MNPRLERKRARARVHQTHALSLRGGAKEPRYPRDVSHARSVLTHLQTVNGERSLHLSWESSRLSARLHACRLNAHFGMATLGRTSMSESGWHAARESWVAQQERRLCICNDDAVVDASHTLIGINSMRHHLTHSPHPYSHGVKAANPCQSRNSASRMGRWHADSLAACRTHPPGRTRSAKAITFWPSHRRRPVSVLLYSCRCPLPLQAQAATFCFLPLGSAFCALTAAAP